MSAPPAAAAGSNQAQPAVDALAGRMEYVKEKVQHYKCKRVGANEIMNVAKEFAVYTGTQKEEHVTKSCKHELNRDAVEAHVEELFQLFVADPCEYQNHGQTLWFTDDGVAAGDKRFRCLAGNHTRCAQQKVGWAKAQTPQLEVVVLDGQICQRAEMRELLELVVFLKNKGQQVLLPTFAEAMPLLAKLKRDYPEYVKKCEKDKMPPLDLLTWAKHHLPFDIKEKLLRAWFDAVDRLDRFDEEMRAREQPLIAEINRLMDLAAEHFHF